MKKGRHAEVPSVTGGVPKRLTDAGRKGKRNWAFSLVSHSGDGKRGAPAGKQMVGLPFADVSAASPCESLTLSPSSAGGAELSFKAPAPGVAEASGDTERIGTSS